MDSNSWSSFPPHDHAPGSSQAVHPPQALQRCTSNWPRCSWIRGITGYTIQPCCGKFRKTSSILKNTWVLLINMVFCTRTFLVMLHFPETQISCISARHRCRIGTHPECRNPRRHGHEKPGWDQTPQQPEDHQLRWHTCGRTERHPQPIHFWKSIQPSCHWAPAWAQPSRREKQP